MNQTTSVSRVKKYMPRSIDEANAKAKKPQSIFKNRDYLGTKRTSRTKNADGSRVYKKEYKYR